MESVRETLGRRLLFGDGAMGTMLQRAGLSAGEVPEIWNLQHPEILKKLHASYLDAGADWVTANTFGANPIKFESRACTWEEALRAGGRTRSRSRTCTREMGSARHRADGPFARPDGGPFV